MDIPETADSHSLIASFMVCELYLNKKKFSLLRKQTRGMMTCKQEREFRDGEKWGDASGEWSFGEHSVLCQKCLGTCKYFVSILELAEIHWISQKEHLHVQMWEETAHENDIVWVQDYIFIFVSNMAEQMAFSGTNFPVTHLSIICH